MLLILIFLDTVLTSPNVCLGAGVDLINMEVNCLAKIYNPTDDTTFETNVPESQLVEFSVVMQSNFNIEAYFDQKIESDGFLGIGSSSREVHKFYSNYYSEQKSLTKIILTLAFVKMTSPAFPFPKAQMDPFFLKAIQLLPVYDKNNKKSVIEYMEFISTWGVAVIDEIILGGIFESNLWYDNMFNSVYSEEKIEEESSWSFAGIIGDGHGSTNTTIHVDKKFNSTIVSEYFYVGGNIKLNQSQYLDWAATVQSKQEIIKYHVIPLTYFIQNRTIRESMKMAINDYGQNGIDMLNKYIKSLENDFIY